MFISDLSIKRPVFAAVIMLALVTLGLFSYRRLPIDFDPKVEFPVITIVTQFRGASPETVEREVSKRIEEAVNPIPGLKTLTSNSREGVSIVVAEFELNVRVDDAANDVRGKVAGVRGQFPDLVDDPVIQKIDINGTPVLSLAVQSKTMSARDLTTLVDRKVRRRFENLPGVGEVDVVGGVKREVGVELDPRQLDYLGMGVNEVIAGLRAENVNEPVGLLTGPETEASVRVTGKPTLVPGFAGMVVAQRDGRAVTLGEVARVVDGQEEQRSLALVNGVPAVAMNVIKQSDANAVAVVDRVKAQIEKLKTELPGGVTIGVVRDGSVIIRDSVDDLKKSILLGGALTILIVFCFLNSWRSTVITGLTLPISVISSFVVMLMMGMSLNVMTMMGLSLVIGILIDDAIVVRENIVRHLEAGKNHWRAARDGTAEIGLAVLATTMSILAVFIPVAFMRGVVGRFFFEFAITVAFAVSVSLLVSFTLDPMLSSRWPDPDIAGEKRRGLGRLLARFNDGFERLAGRYAAWLGWGLDHRKTVVALAIGAFVAGMAAMGSLEGAFMTEFDHGEFQVNFRTAPSASFEESRGRMLAILEQLRGVPEIERTFAALGVGDMGTVREGSIYIKLLERAQRTRNQEAVRQEVRQRLASVAGIRYSVEREATTSHTEKPLQVQLRGESIDELKRLGAAYRMELEKVPGIVDVDVTMDLDAPEYALTVDRHRASDVGLSSADVTAALGVLVGGRVATTYEDEVGDSVDVRLRLPREMRENPEALGSLRLVGPPSATSGGTAPLVPLGDLVRMERGATPSQIDRQALTRQTVITANLDGVALSRAVAASKKAAEDLRLPAGYSFSFGGEADLMQETFGYVLEAILLAVLFVYLVLAAQFESFLDPLAIMLSLPLSLLGVGVALHVTGDTLNIMSMIGLIMLVGLVTKNAILLVDYAKTLRRRDRLGRREALVRSGRTRLRPIMMTTMAMILGMMPIALAIGSGAELRAPMARAVVGGLITSSLLTLFIVPVFYTLFDDATAWLLRVLRVENFAEHEQTDDETPNGGGGQTA